jgi:hypothetical protein
MRSRSAEVRLVVQDDIQEGIADMDFAVVNPRWRNSIRLA